MQQRPMIAPVQVKWVKSVEQAQNNVSSEVAH
jgi:hypothetical protein